MPFIDFGIHNIWKSRQGMWYIEFGPFNNDRILSAICIGNLSSIRKDNRKVSHRILKSLGVFKNE